MSTPKLVSTDPCTGDVVWSGASGDPDAAVAAARAAFPAWAELPFEARAAVAERFAERVRAEAEAFAALISRETGKPLWETRTEAASVAGKIAVSIRAYHDRTGASDGEANGVRQRVRHKPHGVLAVLGPYNFPAHLPNGQITPALLAGNAVVFKPSEQTPAVGERMADLWRAAGLPDGVLQVVQGGGDAGRALAAHPGVDGLLFTGSSTTGAALARQFAETPHRILALEMGGNNPLVAWDVADPAAAAQVVVQSAFLSAGQRCTCARRLIVQRGRSEALIGAILGLVDRLIVGAPFEDPQPFMGPLIDQAAAERMLGAQGRLAGGGARILRPMERLRPGRPFLSPGLIDVTAAAERSDDEHFGPLLQLVEVEDFAAAVAEANRTRYGLAAGLVGGDEALFDRFWRESRAGVLAWNRPTVGAASTAPFGGVGWSGNHRPGAYYAADICAWPVASLEAGQPSAGLEVGLRAEAAR
jgi:succinylglutamic semialdehyde dehydrogenase